VAPERPERAFLRPEPLEPLELEPGFGWLSERPGLAPAESGKLEMD